VAWHISTIACDGLAVSTIGRRLAAIAYAHELAGHEPPTSSKDVKVILAGIRRTLGTAPKRKAAATADRIKLMLDCCPDTMIGIRARALLAFGFAGAFRRSELVALTINDLELMDDGYRVTIRRSKTDQTGEGQVIPIPRGYRLRPVAAVQAWLEAAGIVDSSGPCTAEAVCGRPGAVRARGGRDREAARRPGRARPGRVQRAQPSLRLPDQRGRGGGVGVQDDGRQPASEHGHAVGLRALSRAVQGAGGGGVPVREISSATLL